jgi:hypothetical protein
VSTVSNTANISAAIRVLMDESVPDTAGNVIMSIAELKDLILTAAVSGGEFVTGMICNPGDPSDVEALRFSLRRSGILPIGDPDKTFSRAEITQAYEKGWEDAMRKIATQLSNKDTIDDHLHLCRAVAQIQEKKT